MTEGIGESAVGAAAPGKMITVFSFATRWKASVRRDRFHRGRRKASCSRALYFETRRTPVIGDVEDADQRVGWGHEFIAPPDNVPIIRRAMVGATGIEPVTPTMSR